ncbi:MAG TPA: TonB-dependent receptor [Longimicrobiaceae bacterium]|nr:TonB-dependent receptor [Longimicrobiaceae bacterium]
MPLSQVMRRFLAPFCLALLAAGPLVAQASGTLTGRVTDPGGRAVPAAYVGVGNGRGTQTDASGAYRLRGVPAGTVRVTASRLGYAPVFRTVEVAAGATVGADFTLAPLAVQDVVPLCCGDDRETERFLRVPYAVGSLPVDSVGLAAANTFSELLQARVPGLVVQRSSGSVFAGSRVRLRGPVGLALSNEPLLVIDGVRADGTQHAQVLEVGGQAPSRLDDLNPEDVESVHLLRGPAATARYGPAGAAGVLEVRTRRGLVGGLRLRAHAEGGALAEVTAYPANFGRPGTTGVGTTTRCTRVHAALAACALSGDPVSWSPLEQADPFDAGHHAAAGVAAEGGGRFGTVYLAGALGREQGVYGPDRTDRGSLRAAAALWPSEGVRVDLSAGYLNRGSTLVAGDQSLLSPLVSGLLGEPADHPVTRGYRFPAVLTPDSLNRFDQDLERITAGAGVEWRALSWLDAGVQGGIDHVEDTGRAVAESLAPGFPVLETGAGLRRTRWNAVAHLTGEGRLGDLVSRTTLGGEYLSDEVERDHRTFFPGGPELERSESRVEGSALAGFLLQDLGWRERLFLSAALRLDDPEDEGETLRSHSAGVSWVVSREPVAAGVRWLDEIRVRAAYGAVDRLRGLDALPSTCGLPCLEEPGLEPERIREVEAGVDAWLLGGRLAVELTAYRRETRDAVLAIPAPLGGPGGVLRNGARVRDRGVEGALRTRFPSLGPLEWAVDVSGWFGGTRIRELEPLPVIFGLGGATQRHAPGYPPGAYFARPIRAFADRNGDGVLTPVGCPGPACEVELGDTAEFVGSSLPRRELSVESRLRLFGHALLRVRLHHQGGHEIFNATGSLRCEELNCEALYAPDTPLAEQARVVAAAFMGSDAGFIEDADFVKLREVALTLSAPWRWARRVGASALELTLAGRNLYTWTDYSGFDPEVSFAGQSAYVSADFFTQPQVRRWTARLDLRF